MNKQLFENLEALRRFISEKGSVYHEYAPALEAACNELDERATQPAFDILAHLQRQRDFSENTFGPGLRTKGVCDHIRKELIEVEKDPTDLREWIDVVILALDGAWRCGGTPQQIIEGIVAKQTKNEGRVWPDWRTADPNKAIEHDRSHDAIAQTAPTVLDLGEQGEQVRSWHKVWEVLSEVMPGFHNLSGIGQECAVMAIRKLAASAQEPVAAARAVPEGMPEIRLSEFAHGRVTLNQIWREIYAWTNVACAVAREEGRKAAWCAEVNADGLREENDDLRQRATDAEAKLAAIRAQETVEFPMDERNDDPAEAAFWRFDARHKGYGRWKQAPQSQRDAFKAEYRTALAQSTATPSQNNTSGLPG